MDTLTGYEICAYLSLKSSFCWLQSKKVEILPILEVMEIGVPVSVEVLCFHSHAVILSYLRRVYTPVAINKQIRQKCSLLCLG